MALNLTTDQKARLSVGLAYSDGSTTDLGTQFRYAFDPTGIASVVAGDNALFIAGDAPGSTVLTVRDMGETFAETVDVVVTGPEPEDPPVPPVPVGLVVTIGEPEAK